MMSMRNNAITIRKALLIFVIIMFVATCIVGCGTVGNTTDKTEGTAENSFRKKMADADVTEITVTKDLVLEAPVEVNGTKVICGEGTITAVGDAWTGDDYMIVVQSGVQLTVKGSVSINAGGITGGIHATEGAMWTIEGNASVKNASAGAANTLVEGAFHMNGGVLSGAMGHNVHNLGEVSLSEGEIVGSGTKYAGIYSEGTLTQNGGTVRDAYNNVVVLSGGSFTFNGGNNQDSVHDGIYVAEGAKLSVTAKSATITASGVRGIYLCGGANVDGITLNNSGDSLVKISQTGSMELRGGTLADAGNHSIENAGKLVMTGGSVRNSYNCGIVNTGTLEVTGGSFLDNVNNKAILNKHDGNATISGETIMFSGNRFGIGNEDQATLNLSKAEFLLTTGTNIYAYGGKVNIHDISLGASGSNNVRIYRAEVTMTNVQVLGNSATGSATTHGILLEGGTLNATDVIIRNTTGYGIRNKGGHITAENLEIRKSGKAGGINNTVQDYTGVPGVAHIKNLTVEEVRYNNIVVDGGTLTVENGQLGASGTNNVKITAGVLTLNNVDVLGNLPEYEGTNHAVYCTGGTLEANNVKIKDATFSGLRVNGETAVFKGKNVSIENSGEYGINHTVGKIYINGLTTQGNYYNVVSHGGIVSLSNATMGGTVSNNMRVYGGVLDLNNVVVNGHTPDHLKDAHALFVSGGSLTGSNITVQNVAYIGLRVKGGTANIQGLTVKDAGTDGVWISDGKAIVSDLVIKQAGSTGISATGTADITVIGGSIANTVSHGAKSENDAKLTLEGISVAAATTDGRHAVLAQGGDVHLEDVRITGIENNTTGAGIRINRATSHVTGKGVEIADVNTGISANAGTSDIAGVTTSNVTSHSVLATDAANLVFSDSTFGVSGTNNVKADNKGSITLNNAVIEGTKTNHGIMAENGGVFYGKNITVKNTAGCAVRVKCSSAGNQVEIDGLITENIGAQNIWINKDENTGNVGGVVIRNGDLCRTGTHNVRAEAGNLTMIDTKIQGHQSGVANNIHAIYVLGDVDKVNLDGVTVSDAAGDSLRIASGNVVATNFTSEKTGRNGVWVDGGNLTAHNLTVSGSKDVGVNVSGKAGTVVLNGVNISGSVNNIVVAGVELTVNGYADGSKSQIGTSSKDNVVAVDKGVVRLNNVNVLKSAANNIVATKGKLYLADVTITGGNYSVLVQNGAFAELSNVTITDSVKDGIRVNKADGKAVVNNVQINNPIRYGISSELGTVEVKGDLTITSDAGKSSAICAYNSGKVTAADSTKVTISGTEYGICVDTNASVDMDNVAVSGCVKNSFKMTAGTAVLNGINISGCGSNNILVSGGELTVNGYADGSKSQIGTAKEDNIKATGTGVVRLKNVNVLKTSKNNVVAIDGGEIHLTDSAVTGGNHGVLAQNGKVNLTNVVIHASTDAGIRANRADSSVEATNVTIDGSKTGLSISSGTVTITDITVRNTKEAGVSVAQGDSAANVTLMNLVAANCGTHAIFTSGADANLTVNGATLSNDGSDHVVNLNGGPMTLNDVAIDAANLATGKHELYSGAGWLTIGGAMDADVYIATNPGGVIKVNKELTGNDLVVDWKNAPTGAALEFTSEAMMNASKDNVSLGATQTAADSYLYFYSGSDKGYAKLMNKVVTNETQLNDYLAYAASQNLKEVEILLGGSFDVANQVTIPASITNLTIADDGNAETGDTVTYTGSTEGLFVMHSGLRLTLKDISLNSTKTTVLKQSGGELVIENCILDGATKNIYQSAGKLTIRNTDLKFTTSNNVTISNDRCELILEGDILIEGPNARDNIHGLYIEKGIVTIKGDVTVAGTGGAAIQCVNASSITLEKTGTVTINGGGRAGLLVSHQATMVVHGELNIANTTGPAIALGYWGGENAGNLIIANGGKVTVGKDADGKGIANVGIQIKGKGVLNVQAGAQLTVSDTTGHGIHVIESGTLMLAGKVNASVVSDKLPVEVTGELTGNLVVDWTTAPSGNVMTFASAAVMNASKDNIELGSIQGASNMLKYAGTAAALTPYTTVTGWNDLSAKVSALASGSKTTFRIAGDVSNWQFSAPVTIPAGAEVILLADHKSPAIVAASAVSPFMLNANSKMTLENVVVGGTDSVKAKHIIVPETATLTLKNATLQHFGDVKGGAVHVNNGTLIATGSTFANNSNTTDWGGAIGIWGGTVNISGSTFTENTSKNSGGAIINYKADSGSLGGSKNNAVGTLTLTDCVFTGNSSSNEHGGAVASWSGGTTTITGCTFESNSAVKNGGAIHVQDSHNATIAGCTFTSNSASSEGGAVYHKSSVQMAVTNSTFTGNIAKGVGGAISLRRSAEVNGATFTGNSGTEGGAISTDSNLKVSGTKFEKNQSTTGRAGAVIVWNAVTVEFNDCEFISNTAKTNGGAVGKGGNAGGVLTFTDCDFDGNSALNGEGGALMLQSSPSVTITGSTFTGNSAKTNGGVIKNNSSTTAIKIENSEFSKNTAGDKGGVLYQQDGKRADLINCIFAENTATEGNAVHSVGGTVYLTGGNILAADCSGKYSIVKE